ncbi:MAG: UDP-2,4-diacetamido-2,4,6-trideoxy-beta-L-altropyranose hydrolase [Rubrivivax sp.]
MALRADASSQTGLGHIKRSMALAQALQEAGAEVCLVARGGDVDTATLAADAGIRHVQLPAAPAQGGSAGLPSAAGLQTDWAEDAERTVAALGGWRPGLVVVDSYGLDARWHRAVGAALDARMAAIDDLGDRELAVDWLIDHNHAPDHRVKYAGHLPAGAKLVCGPRYALLAPVYATAARCTLREQVRSIGIFMGGTDSAGLSGDVLRACRQGAGFAGPIEVASTRANRHLAELQADCQRWANTTLSLDAPDLAAFFARHDLQIGAGGGATWERCCIGAPTVALVAADNQRVVIPALAQLGVLATTQPSEPLTAAAIATTVAALLQDPARRKDMARRARKLVDGLGARRVALRLAASTLSLRPALPADAELMYAWRNHPATREMSLESREIAWTEHHQWLLRTLADPARLLLVASVGSIRVGVVRFDGKPDARAAVSLYLDPQLQGLGLGSAMLLAGERRACRQAPPPLGFEARVVAANVGSQRLFKSAGYLQHGERWTKMARPNASAEG